MLTELLTLIIIWALTRVLYIGVACLTMTTITSRVSSVTITAIKEKNNRQRSRAAESNKLLFRVHSLFENLFIMQLLISLVNRLFRQHNYKTKSTCIYNWQAKTLNIELLQVELGVKNKGTFHLSVCLENVSLFITVV